MCFYNNNSNELNMPVGIQLLGVELFHINQCVDFLIDIYNIKIYFSTEFYSKEEYNKNTDNYFPLNYLFKICLVVHMKHCIY